MGRYRVSFVTLLAGACLVIAPSVCLAQAINIDLDVFFGDPELGNGAPSDAFGAAAQQPGRWNRIGFGWLEFDLVDTNGDQTNVRGTMESHLGNFGGIGFRNESNTGDYALLLNDAIAVNNVFQGGGLTFTFEGLVTGLYDVYTYAVRPSGTVVDTPIFVPQAVSNHTQVVTGPMPGNAFEYLVTHSIHAVKISEGESFQIICERPPGIPVNSFINGFQIVPVPETNSLIILVFGCFTLVVLRRGRGLGTQGKH